MLSIAYYVYTANHAAFIIFWHIIGYRIENFQWEDILFDHLTRFV